MTAATLHPPVPCPPRRLPGRATAAGWLALAVSAGIYVALSVAGHGPLHSGPRALGFFDLRIYRDGAERILDGQPLYRHAMIHRLGFTYPPFAALLLVPLALLPLGLDDDLVSLLNLALLVWMMRRTLMIGRPAAAADWSSGARAWSLAALLAAGALWLEPVSVTVGYGQINILIAALVIFDLSRPADAPWQGVTIGVAAAIKLTPLVFIAYLLLSGRRRAAAVAGGTFAATIALAYVTTGANAVAYWSHGLLLRSSRVGRVGDWSNGSLTGAIVRFTHARHPGSLGEAGILAVAVVGLGLAGYWGRRGDEAAGFSLAALTALLISPVSWSHHWTLAVPALVLLARRAHMTGSWPLWVGAGLLTLIGAAFLPERAGLPHHIGAGAMIEADAYAGAAMIVLLSTALWGLAPAVVSRRRRPAPE